MGTGYVRADTGNNIANGNFIDATYLDQEFDAVQAGFHASTGHVHDGTTANGAPITVLGPAQDFIATSLLLYPKTTNVYDLGTSVLRYKTIYLSGDVVAGNDLKGKDLELTDSATIAANAAIGGTLSVTGVITATAGVSGNASTATVLQTARTIAISGGITSTATSFNGSANITIPVTAINADYISSGNVPVANLPEVGETGLDTWFNSVAASAVIGSVGTLAFLLNSTGTTLSPGDTVNNTSTSDLTWSNTSNNAFGAAPPGTWRCLGRATTGSATLFVRTL